MRPTESWLTITVILLKWHAAKRPPVIGELKGILERFGVPDSVVIMFLNLSLEYWRRREYWGYTLFLIKWKSGECGEDCETPFHQVSQVWTVRKPCSTGLKEHSNLRYRHSPAEYLMGLWCKTLLFSIPDTLLKRIPEHHWYQTTPEILLQLAQQGVESYPETSKG